jgi:hypothetical protein
MKLSQIHQHRRKNRMLSLSIRAKDDAELAEVLEEYQQSNASRGRLHWANY